MNRSKRRKSTNYILSFQNMTQEYARVDVISLVTAAPKQSYKQQQQSHMQF